MISDLCVLTAPLFQALKGLAGGIVDAPGYWIRKITYRNRDVAVVLSVGGPRSGSAWVADRAAKLGFRPVVFSPQYPARETRFAGGWVRIDCIADTDRAIKEARKIGAKVVLSDHRNAFLTPVARMQQELGLRGLGRKSPQSSGDKRVFRNALDEAGVANLKWAVIDKGAVPPFDFPFIIKPNFGTGSRGVLKIRNQTELEKAVSDPTAKPKDAVWIAEEFVPARQFDVEGVARDGEYCILSITEEHYTETAGRFPSTWFLFSPPIPEAWKDVLKTMVRDALAASGVVNGAFHFEVRLTNDLRCVPIDYSNRYGYPIMVSECAGVDFVKTYARTLIDAPFQCPEVREGTVFQQYAATEEQRRAYKRLIRENPAKVIEARMLGSMVGGVRTFGRVSLRADSFADIAHLLHRYDLMPEIWHDYYGDAVSKALKENALS